MQNSDPELFISTTPLKWDVVYESSQNLRKLHITLIVLLFLHEVLDEDRKYLMLKLLIRKVFALHSLNGYIHGLEAHLNVRIGKQIE